MNKFIAVICLLTASAFGAGIPYLTEPTNSRVDTYIPQATGPNQKWVPYANLTNSTTNPVIIRAGSGIMIGTNLPAGFDYTVNSTNWVYDARTTGITNSIGPVGVTNGLKIFGSTIQFTNNAGFLTGTNAWTIGQITTSLGISANQINSFGFLTNGSFYSSNFVTPTNFPIVGNVLIATNTLGQSMWGPAPAGSLWTNDLDGPIRILRPIDQTRMVETFSIGTNNRALTAIVQDTNTAEHYTQGAYLENVGTNSGPRSLYDGDGSYGAIGESFGDSGALMPGKDGVGLHGLADSGYGLQYGVQGLAVALYSGQTNVGVAGSSVSGGSSTVTNVGVYAEVYNVAQGSAVQPNMIGSVLLGDSRNIYVPLLTLRTNGSTIKWQVNADGNLKQVNGAASGSVMTSDANGVGTWQPASSAASNAVAVAAGTNITAVTNSGVVTISVSNTNLPVVAAGTNVTVATNGLVYTVSSTASGGGGGSGVGPGTLNHLSMFNSTTTNVVDSNLIQEATNQWAYKQSPSTYTNNLTNVWYASYTSASSNRGFALDITPTLVNLHEFANGTIAPNSFSGMYLNDAWHINGLGVNSAVTPVGDLLPMFDSTGANGVTIGNGSSKVRYIYLAAGTTAGVFFPNGGCISSTDYRVTSDLGKWQIQYTGGGGGNQLVSLTGGATQKLNLGTTTLTGGAAQDDAADVFLSRPTLPTYGMWALGTNNNSTTKARAQILSGPASDDNAVNRAGGDLLLLGGPASGNGTNGNVSLGTFIQGASGFGYGNIQSNRLTIHSMPINLTTNSSTTVCTFTVPTSLQNVAGEFAATVQVKDATDVASIHERFAFNAINKAGTVTATNQSVPTITSPLATGSAGVTTVWTISVSGTTCSIKCNATTTGLNATTARLVGARIELDSDALSAVNFQ